MKGPLIIFLCDASGRDRNLKQHSVIAPASYYWYGVPLLVQNPVIEEAYRQWNSNTLSNQYAVVKSAFRVFSKSRYCIDILFFFRIIYRYQAKLPFVYLNSVIRLVFRYFSAFSIRLVSHYWTISPFLQSKIQRGEVRCFLMVVNKYVHQFLA